MMTIETLYRIFQVLPSEQQAWLMQVMFAYVASYDRDEDRQVFVDAMNTPASQGERTTQILDELCCELGEVLVHAWDKFDVWERDRLESN